jgi:phosphoribosylcarboxyaminoimidazole (NCAIR) mutase
MARTTPAVGVIMGSQSDWQTMRAATELLQALGIPHEARIVSAHRTPRRLVAYAGSARRRGLKVIIAGALLAASILSLGDRALERRLAAWRDAQTAAVAREPVDLPATPATQGGR